MLNKLTWKGGRHFESILESLCSLRIFYVSKLSTRSNFYHLSSYSVRHPRAASCALRSPTHWVSAFSSYISLRVRQDGTFLTFLRPLLLVGVLHHLILSFFATLRYFAKLLRFFIRVLSSLRIASSTLFHLPVTTQSPYNRCPILRPTLQRIPA